MGKIFDFTPEITIQKTKISGVFLGVKRWKKWEVMGCKGNFQIPPQTYPPKRYKIGGYFWGGKMM